MISNRSLIAVCLSAFLLLFLTLHTTDSILRSRGENASVLSSSSSQSSATRQFRASRVRCQRVARLASNGVLTATYGAQTEQVVRACRERFPSIQINP